MDPVPTLPMCYLCGINLGVTSDHVPPKVIFPEPRPGNLLTLPTCVSCNQSYSADEEEFAETLSLAISPTYSLNAEKIFQKFRRYYRRKPGRLARIMSRMREWVPVTTPSGLIVGHTRKLAFDVNKTKRVLRKIAAGLHYRHTGQRIPSSCESLALFHSQKIRQLTAEQIALDLWQQAQYHQAWDPHFRYHGYVAPENIGSIWWLRIYSYHLGIVLFGFEDESPIERKS